MDEKHGQNEVKKQGAMLTLQGKQCDYVFEGNKLRLYVFSGGHGNPPKSDNDCTGGRGNPPKSDNDYTGGHGNPPLRSYKIIFYGTPRLRLRHDPFVRFADISPDRGITSSPYGATIYFYGRAWKPAEIG